MNTIERILALLDNKGIQQKELANELGFNETNISEWKAGRNKSYKKYIYQIAEYLDTPVAYLMCETDDPTPPNKKKPEPGEPGSGMAYRRGSNAINENTRSGDPERDALIAEVYKIITSIDDIEILKDLSDYSDYLVSRRKRNK